MMHKNKWKWYYGWNIAISASIITLMTAGFRMSVGPFFLPLLNDFDITRTTLSVIVAVGMFTFGVAMPIAGFLESRYGPRTTLLLGTGIVLVSGFWMIYAKTALHLMLSFGVFLSIGLALTSQITLTPIIVKWFVRRRGQALFYLSTGSMAGIAIMNPVSNILIEAYSWQHAIAIFVIGFTILIGFVAIFVIHDDVPEGVDQLVEKDSLNKESKVGVDPEKHLKHLRVKDAVKTLPFWQISIGLFACGYSMNLLGSHGVPMLIDHGFTSSTASFSIGLIGLVAIPGTFILGSIADRMKRQGLLALIYITRGIGFVFIVLVMAPWQLYLVALIAGLAWAGNVALSSALLSDVYGVHLVGMLYGIAYFFHQVGATISTLFGGWAYETLHTHLISFSSAAILLFIAGFISLKIREDFKKEKVKQKSA